MNTQMTTTEVNQGTTEITSQGDMTTDQDIKLITEKMQETHLTQQEQSPPHSQQSWSKLQHSNKAKEETVREPTQYSEKQHNYTRTSQVKDSSSFKQYERSEDNKKRYYNPCFYCLQTGHRQTDCNKYKEFKK